MTGEYRFSFGPWNIHEALELAVLEHLLGG